MMVRFLLSIALILLLSGCDFEPRDVTFYVWEEECWNDVGRTQTIVKWIRTTSGELA